MRAFADAYGMTAEHRSKVVAVAYRMVANVALTSRPAAAVDPVFRRWWHEGLRDRLTRAVAWLATESQSHENRL